MLGGHSARQPATWLEGVGPGRQPPGHRPAIRGRRRPVVGPHLATVARKCWWRARRCGPIPTGCRSSSTPPDDCSHVEVLDLYQAHAVTSWRSSIAGPERWSESSSSGRAARPASPGSPATTDGARGVPGGLPSIRPGHRHVPDLPGPLGTGRLPRARRAAAGPVRAAGHRGDGHQGGGPPALGRRATVAEAGAGDPVGALGHVMVRAGGHRRGHRPWSCASPFHAGVHGFCTPGDIDLLPRV